MVRLTRIAVALCCLLISGSAFATNYYIDYSSGSDSNNGTSKTSPWQHLPGMPGCQAQCAAASPKPADQLILKGGVTWPNSSLGWEWTWSGSAGNPIYIGVDQAWYAGGSWTRPIFNGGGQPIATWYDSNHTARVNEYFGLSANYVTVDNIEWTGFYENYAGSYCQDDYICMHYSSTNLQIENNYFHGWSHGAYGGNQQDGGQCISGDTSWPTGNATSSIHDNVFDGADTTGDSMAALHGGPDTVYNNYVNNMSNGFVGEYGLVHDNVILNINASYNTTMHENGIEINFAGTAYVYNNVIAHVKQGLAVWLAPESGYTQYFYNNVEWDIPITNIVDLADALQQCCGQIALYNNTIECGPDGNPTFLCVGVGANEGATTLGNNHGITNATTPNKGMWFETGNTQVTESNDLPQAFAAATKQGYASSEAYPFSPVSSCTPSTCSTVQAGMNLTGQCSILPGLCNDTTLGISYNTTNHTVSYPARTPNPRPTTGAWDAGAYEYSSGNVPPAPPTNLSAVVN